MVARLMSYRVYQQPHRFIGSGDDDMAPVDEQIVHRRKNRKKKSQRSKNSTELSEDSDDDSSSDSSLWTASNTDDTAV